MVLRSRAHRSALLDRLARAYVWWESPTGTGLSEDRLLAQAMNIGSYDDILLIEGTFGAERLASVMRSAQPGWFNPRSWEFWRGRLRHRGLEVRDMPPQRRFDAAVP